MSPLKNSPGENLDNLQEQSGVRKKRVRLPSFYQWTELPSVLSKVEKILFSVFILGFFASLIFLLNSFYTAHTHIVPARGGEIVEGIVGSPRFINPVYSEANDPDRDLVELIFSGLLQYNSADKLVRDLAADFPIEEVEGTVFVVDLKENVVWHDGKPFGADDVIFTVQTLQDPKYKSPIRANWVGVEVEKISDFRVRFTLAEPYAPFLERLTVKIMPAHIWKDITPENFALSVFNLQPVGTGPYKFVSLSREKTGAIKEIVLAANKQHHKKPPFIESIILRFFETGDTLAQEATGGNLNAFSLGAPNHISNTQTASFVSYSFSFPRYFALFFNLNPPEKQEVVTNRNIRKALTLITDKEAIQSQLLGEYGRVVSSPLLPEIFGFQLPENVQSKDPEAALKLLEDEDYMKREDGKLVKIPPQISGEFQSRLKEGSQGTEVTNLQTCLTTDPEVYPEGQVTGLFGPLTKRAVIKFQEKYAEEVLTPSGLTSGTGVVGPSTRAKLNEICFEQSQEPILLQITITTVDQFPLKETAQLLAEQWEEFGIQVEVLTYAPTEIERDVIKPRAYETLLFGEILGKIPDLFPFWHSSQIKDPGLNLSSLENDDADKLLERARKETDPQERTEIHEQLQEILLQETPAIFLYDINYTYFVSNEVKEIQEQVISDPSKRFSGITEWYMKTKRAWK